MYKLKLQPAKGNGLTIPFVVTNPGDESDLTPLKAADWKAIARDLNATLIDSGGLTIADVLTGSRAGKEIWGLLVLGVIACALAETWLAGRWSREN